MTQIRIGDAERDAAASSLGEHYAAGRLTKTEYDERVDEVWAARFEHDLTPLFADLPRGPREVEPRAARPERRLGPGSSTPPWAQRGPWPPVARFVPIAVMALVALVIVTGTPWLLFGLFWLWMFGAFGNRRRPGPTHWHHHSHNMNRQAR